jgi:hypothetical protein
MDQPFARHPSESWDPVPSSHSTQGRWIDPSFGLLKIASAFAGMTNEIEAFLEAQVAETFATPASTRLPSSVLSQRMPASFLADHCRRAHPSITPRRVARRCA